MHLVTEHRLTGKRNISGLVTFNAIALDGKCRLAFMTGPAGLSLFHLQHCIMRIGPIRLEQTVVAIDAAVHAEMLFVTEYQ